MRLNLFIAKSGYTSRRGAERLIKQGRVQVNGRKVLEPFFPVGDKDWVKIGKKHLKPKEYIYIIFNKPRGVTTTLYDQFAARKVIDFFPKKFKGIYPVGRLDKNSCGLLILTNDGDFCYKLTHPKFSVEKEYLLKLKGVLTRLDRERAKKGCKVEGEQLKVKSIKLLATSGNKTLCRVTVVEGKNRHLRRLFEKLGFPVRQIKRIRIGALTLGSLASGRYELISRDRIYSFFNL